MTHTLDKNTTRHFLTSCIPGNPSVKRAATQLADRVAAQFILYLEKNLIEACGKKIVTDDDVIELLKNKGFDEYIDSYKKGAKEEDEDSEDEDSKTKKKGSAKKTKKSKKGD